MSANVTATRAVRWRHDLALPAAVSTDGVVPDGFARVAAKTIASALVNADGYYAVWHVEGPVGCEALFLTFIVPFFSYLLTSDRQSFTSRGSLSGQQAAALSLRCSVPTKVGVWWRGTVGGLKSYARACYVPPFAHNRNRRRRLW